MQVPFNVDIGVGDVIIPGVQRRKINTQLTGRKKDFYDIYYLSQTFSFDGFKLQTAIFETLRNRGTLYGKDSFDRIVQLANDSDMQLKWRYFLKNIKDDSLDFAIVIEQIKIFLEPVYNALLSESEWHQIWDSRSIAWLSR